MNIQRITCFSFGKQNQKPIMTGVDYSGITSRKMPERLARSTNSPEYQDEFILSKINRTMELAKEEAKKHPEIPEEDFVQAYLLALVEATRGGKSSNIYQKISNRCGQEASKLIRDSEDRRTVYEPYELTVQSPHEEVIREESREYLESVLEKLSPREETIIRKRYGLTEDGKCHSRQEISEKFHTSIDRIRNIEQKAFKRLRHPENSSILRERLDDLNQD